MVAAMVMHMRLCALTMFNELLHVRHGGEVEGGEDDS